MSKISKWFACFVFVAVTACGDVVDPPVTPAVVVPVPARAAPVPAPAPAPDEDGSSVSVSLDGKGAKVDVKSKAGDSVSIHAGDAKK